MQRHEGRPVWCPPRAVDSAAVFWPKLGQSMASAFGKVILVGEHAVVYGVPAIAVGVAVAATASAARASRPSLTLGERRWELAEPDAAASPEARAFEALVDALVGARGAARTLSAEVALHQPSGVGLGASAAIAVALARAVSDALGVPSARRPAGEILAAAQAWENVFHGRASGVDAAAAYHGGCLWFEPPAPAEPLPLSQPLRLAVAVAGPAASTRSMVESVAALRQAEPVRVEHVLRSIHALVLDARVALQRGRMSELGALLDRNHRLLGELGVSTPGLDAACERARAAGALGAKLTGGGGGGCVLALAGEDGTGPLLEAWREEGLSCFDATVASVAPA
jgi:mevalonate kinase